MALGRKSAQNLLSLLPAQAGPVRYRARAPAAADRWGPPVSRRLPSAAAAENPSSRRRRFPSKSGRLFPSPAELVEGKYSPGSPLSFSLWNHRLNRFGKRWNRVICFCKVQWSNHSEEESTWEREDELKSAHPYLFASSSESRGRDSV